MMQLGAQTLLTARPLGPVLLVGLFAPRPAASHPRKGKPVARPGRKAMGRCAFAASVAGCRKDDAVPDAGFPAYFRIDLYGLRDDDEVIHVES